MINREIISNVRGFKISENWAQREGVFASHSGAGRDGRVQYSIELGKVLQLTGASMMRNLYFGTDMLKKIHLIGSDLDQVVTMSGKILPNYVNYILLLSATKRMKDKKFGCFER